VNAVFYWTGVAVWGAAAVAAFWLLVVETLVGFATSVSYYRWVISTSSRFEWRKHGLLMVKELLAKAVTEFYGFRNDGSYTVTCQTTGSHWRGVGDWTCLKKEKNHE
jgi:hypothetical protein